MSDYISDLRETVERWAPDLLAMSDSESSRRPAPGKWSAREIVGHLIDSAANNHQRFIRGQFQDDLVFPGYDQNVWARVQDYQGAPWPALVELWRGYNLHLAHVMARVPHDVRTRPRRRHNLHEIGWQTLPQTEAASLDYMMRDYVGHLKHHLSQVLVRRDPGTWHLAGRPAPDEYAPYYARYVDRVPDGDLCETLLVQLAGTLELLRGIPEERGDYRYAPDKWTVKDVVGHMSDTERIMSYRALRIARGDTTPIPGYEQDDYVRGARAARRTLQDLTEEFRHVRLATVGLVRSLEPEAVSRRGTANGLVVSVRGLAYIVAGHELHHVEILRSRYLNGASRGAGDQSGDSVGIAAQAR